jgi:hypothetical protein
VVHLEKEPIRSEKTTFLLLTTAKSECAKETDRFKPLTYEQSRKGTSARMFSSSLFQSPGQDILRHIIIFEETLTIVKFIEQSSCNLESPQIINGELEIESARFLKRL